MPSRELRSGYAEVIKHCIISDRAMWDVIRKKGVEGQDWETVIRHSVDFKTRVVTEDPKEKGLRKILNFGHTLGHAIENSFGYGRYLHGEAISIGQVLAARLSRDLLGLPQKDAIRINNLFFAAGLPNVLKPTAALRRKRHNPEKTAPPLTPAALLVNVQYSRVAVAPVSLETAPPPGLTHLIVLESL